MSQGGIRHYTARWNGIVLRVSFTRDWMKSFRGTSLLEVHSIAPEKEPLPITETGYRAYNPPAAEIDAAGGPVAYVLAWLDVEAKKPKWRAADLSRRQLSLF